MSMTFYVGNTKLKDGTAIKHERENLRPGDPVLTKDGGTLPNGTYTDAKGKSFTVANGKVGSINVVIQPEPVVEPIVDPVVVIEPVAETVKVEPVENPIVETVVITPETPAT